MLLLRGDEKQVKIKKEHNSKSLAQPDHQSTETFTKVFCSFLGGHLCLILTLKVHFLVELLTYAGFTVQISQLHQH